VISSEIRYLQIFDTSDFEALQKLFILVQGQDSSQATLSHVLFWSVGLNSGYRACGQSIMGWKVQPFPKPPQG
jgi:hypothetical protein